MVRSYGFVYKEGKIRREGGCKIVKILVLHIVSEPKSVRYRTMLTTVNLSEWQSVHYQSYIDSNTSWQYKPRFVT